MSRECSIRRDFPSLFDEQDSRLPLHTRLFPQKKKNKHIQEILTPSTNRIISKSKPFSQSFASLLSTNRPSSVDTSSEQSPNTVSMHFSTSTLFTVLSTLSMISAQNQFYPRDAYDHVALVARDYDLYERDFDTPLYIRSPARTVADKKAQEARIRQCMDDCRAQHNQGAARARQQYGNDVRIQPAWRSSKTTIRAVLATAGKLAMEYRLGFCMEESCKVFRSRCSLPSTTLAVLVQNRVLKGKKAFFETNRLQNTGI